MKCTVCAEHRKNPMLKKLSDVGYPIHHVCISEYFEKIGQTDMDSLCDTFNAVHFGYLMNLVQFSNKDGIDIDVPNPTSAPPIVVWTETPSPNSDSGMFVLGSKFSDGEPVNHNELTFELYSKLKEVPSQAYSMVYNATMNQVNEDRIQSQFEKHNISESDWERYSHDDKLKTIKKWFGNPSEMDIGDFIEMGDAVVIQGQSLGTNFHYRAVGDIGEHNGMRYIKPLKLEDITDHSSPSLSKELDEIKNKIKDHIFSDELFGEVENKFKDYTQQDDDDDDDENPLFRS